MVYIFMDESWDLWFDSLWTINSSYFILTFLILNTPKDADIIMKKTYSRMAWKGIRIKETFFHSNKESRSCVMKLLKLCSYRDIKIAYLTVNKNQRHSYEKIDKHHFYNFLVGNLIQHCTEKWIISLNDTIFFTASRRETKKELVQSFLNDIKEYTKKFLDFRVKIWSPSMEKWLEVVDAFSFAYYKKIESKDPTLYDIIKDKVILEVDYILDRYPTHNS